MGSRECHEVSGVDDNGKPFYAVVCVRGSGGRVAGSCKDWIKPGATAWFLLGGKKHACVIKQAKYIGHGDYYSCEIEIVKVNPFCPTQVLRQVYPKPVQSYLLTKRKEGQMQEVRSNVTN